jgi:hypothetical protein
LGASEALGIFLQAVTLAIGLQFIGWSKWRARLAEEAWLKRGGPLDAKLIVDLRSEVDATSTHIRRAGQGLEAAARQFAREAS